VDLLVVGHVTRDEIDGGLRLGGAASYAALAAARLGYETAVVTVAVPGDPLLEPLLAMPRLSLHCAPSDVMTTFALDYAAGERRLWLRHRARPLTLDDVPSAWRRPRVAYVGPVAGECDGALVRGLGAEFVGAGIQGWLRRIGDDGLVQPARLADAMPDLPDDLPVLDAAIISELDHPAAERTVRSIVGTNGAAAITRGARGATLLRGSERVDVPAAPARELDPTGAGDIFGVVLTLALARGESLRTAGDTAAEAAARVVEGPGLGTLAPRA
jgi:sugar/nucleoside kinase (ribokinase family)